MIDWSAGRYEHTADELRPVSEHAITLAGLRGGERVLDLATGTGNAAVLAARAGAVVTGLDGAPRLLAVARERAASEGLAARFVAGDLGALPFEDASFDVVVSVFGVIFAEDPDRTVAEIVRVLGGGGRALLAVWVPAGPIDAMVGVIGRAMAAVSGSSPRRFVWSDADAVGALAAGQGVTVSVHDGRLAITAQSPEAYVSTIERFHPMSVASRPVLERAGTYTAVREQMVAILREANEDPAAFRVSSPYRVLEVSRAR